MRNKYVGTCYYCGEHCEAGDGHFERFRGGWRVQHASCAFDQRREKRLKQKGMVTDGRFDRV